MGIKPTDAVNMFMYHVAMFKELPFRPKIPNEETLQLLQDTEEGKNFTRHTSVDEMFAHLDA